MSCRINFNTHAENPDNNCFIHSWAAELNSNEFLLMCFTYQNVFGMEWNLVVMEAKKKPKKNFNVLKSMVLFYDYVYENNRNVFDHFLVGKLDHF